MTSFELKQPAGRELLGGDLVAQCLQYLGVSVAFGLHGGHLDAFLMGCADIGIHLVDTRHETVAVQAAESYSKVSGKTGVCFVTANSGFCNGLPGLATAFADRSSIFCITSSPPLRDAETNALQGFHDQVVLAKPVTKFAHRVTNVGEIPRLISLAWRTASAGIPGPVLLDFPIDVLFTPVDNASVAWGSLTASVVKPPGPDATVVAEAVKLLKQAQRPCIIVGTGARNAVDEVTKLAESKGIPIFNSPKFSTHISYSHPFRAGSATNLAILNAIKGVQPDLIILLGARTGFLLGGRNGSVIPNSDCKLIQVDLDGGEIGRSHHVDLGVVSDVKLFVSALDRATSENLSRCSEEWIRASLALKQHRVAHNEDESVIDSQNGKLHPYHALKKLFQSLPDDSIVCIDGGDCGGWSLQLLEEAHASLAMVTTGYLGFLGNGWGYALGAAIADPERLVINMQGDGSAGFHIAELDTYSKFKLNILTVVMNNSHWAMSNAGQDIMYGQHTSARPAVRLREGTRYDIVAEGFGCTAVVVDATERQRDRRRGSFMEQGLADDPKVTKVLDAIGAAVDECVQEEGPGLINLVVSEKPIHDTTKAMVGKTDDEDIIVVPYYDNLPRPRYGKEKNNKDGRATIDSEHRRMDSAVAD